MERESRIDSLINNWMSNNYDHKSLMDTIKDIDKKSKFLDKKKEEVPVEKVQSEWQRLSRFMKQRK